MTTTACPPANAEITERRRQLIAGVHGAVQRLSRPVVADGALDDKTRQLISVAAAHVMQCQHCIRSQTRIALRTGATEREVTEAVSVAEEIWAGRAHDHSTVDGHVRPYTAARGS
jgi:AhpD family alkylhydroperoxidase